MKMKEFGPQGGRASLAPPLDPPMRVIRYLPYPQHSSEMSTQVLAAFTLV